MNQRRRMCLILGVSSMILAGCLGLNGATSTPTRYYLLESVVETVSPSSHRLDETLVPIGVGPLTIAPYLKRPQMVTRVSENELRADEFHQWAEPLKANVTRVMAENLRALTAAKHIHTHPWKRSDDVRVKITVDVLQFDADAMGQVTLKAVWRIIETRDRKRLAERRSTITQPSGGRDADQIVTSMSVALADLSREMAESIMRLSAL